MTPRCPSDLALESYLLNPARSQVTAHVDGCPRCRERLGRMREEGVDFARNVFPLTVDAVERAAARPPWWRRRAFILPIPALAAMAAVLFLVNPTAPPAGYLGVKGGSRLGLTLFTPGPSGVAPVLEGGSVRAAAAIRFRVRAPAGCHLWIVSLDGTGAVSRLYPASGEQGEWIPAGEHDLPGGAILDAHVGPERVYAVCTPHALPWSTVESTVRASATRPASLRGAAPLGGLPPGAAWTSVLLEKVP